MVVAGWGWLSSQEREKENAEKCLVLSLFHYVSVQFGFNLGHAGASYISWGHNGAGVVCHVLETLMRYIHKKVQLTVSSSRT